MKKQKRMEFKRLQQNLTLDILNMKLKKISMRMMKKEEDALNLKIYKEDLQTASNLLKKN